MNTDHTPADDVILHAIDAGECDTTHVEQCAVCRQQREEVYEVMAQVATAHVAEPPFSLRSRVLNDALHRRAAGSDPSLRVASADGIDAYLRSVETLDAFLDTLTNVQRQAVVVNNWNVGNVVAHLRIVDEVAVAALQGDVEGSLVDIEQCTARALATPETFVESRNRWRQQSAVLLHARKSCYRTTVDYLGFELEPEAVILDRAFETWLHTQDIRVAIGLDCQPPPAPDLNALTGLGAHMTARIVDSKAHGLRGSVQLVFRGVGNWSVNLDARDREEGPHTTVALDAVDFCLFIGDRLRLDDLPFTVDGDEGAAHYVLSCAAELARL
jgi:uncharacterized protein (TIGR03083 family)